jgi:hypothetical protein
MCARALAKHPVVVCCAGIPKADLEAMFFRPVETPQTAVDAALQMSVIARSKMRLAGMHGEAIPEGLGRDA